MKLTRKQLTQALALALHAAELADARYQTVTGERDGVILACI